MDEYIACKQREGVSLKAEKLHLLGTASLLLGSKYDDRFHIDMETILNEVTHNKFKSETILEMEQDILRTLEFRIP